MPTPGAEPSFDTRTALIVVDVQNDFADPTGSLYVNQGEQVVARINQLVQRALQAGSLVVYTQDWHPEQTPHFVEQGGRWPPHCVRDTWGAEFVPSLQVRGPVIRKGTGGEDGYSGFSVRDERTGDQHRTELDATLRARGIERAVIVGLALDVCVKETALDAGRLGYNTWVVREATRPVNPEALAPTLNELTGAGVEVV